MLLKKTQREIWTRGQAYADKAKVEVIDSNDYQVEANVLGTETYFVNVRFVPKGISLDCSCPYFKRTVN